MHEVFRIARQVSPGRYKCGMSIQLNDQLREALRQNPGEPLHIHDEASQKDYVLVERDAIPWNMLSCLREAVEEGLRDVEAGWVYDWDPEDIKRRGRERLALRQQDESHGASAGN
jgi:hypothetical protein